MGITVESEITIYGGPHEGECLIVKSDNRSQVILVINNNGEPKEIAVGSNDLRRAIENAVNTGV